MFSSKQNRNQDTLPQLPAALLDLVLPVPDGLLDRGQIFPGTPIGPATAETPIGLASTPPRRTLARHLTDTFTPSTICEEILCLWLSRFSPRMEAELITSLRRYSQVCGSVVTTGSGCSGTDIAAKCDEDVVRVLNAKYGLDLTVVPVLACEQNESKQHLWKLENPDVPVLVPDLCHMASQRVPNLLKPTTQGIQSNDAWSDGRNSCEYCCVPAMSLYRAGFTCCARSSLHVNAANNINCVQSGTESTGVCYSLLDRAMAVHTPEAMNYECCASLMQHAKAPNGTPIGESDAEFIVGKLKAAGYWAKCQSIDAKGKGAMVARVRAWWEAIRGLRKGIDSEIDEYFDRMLAAFDVPKDVPLIPLSRMILVSSEERRRASANAGFPSWPETGMRVAAQTGKRNDSPWKPLHMKMFQQFGITWPVVWEFLPEDTKIQYDGLREREAEVIYFLCHAFELAELGDKSTDIADFEFVNDNDQLTRICEKCFEINPDGSCTVKKTPWKPHPPTLVGSSKLMVRTRLQGQTKVEVRQLEAVEYWALQGWDQSWFIKPESSDYWMNTPKVKNAHQFIDVCSNMSGNAFSIFHAVPMFLSTLATMGRYTVLDVGEDVASDDDDVCEEANQLGEVEEVSSESSASS